MEMLRSKLNSGNILYYSIAAVGLILTLLFIFTEPKKGVLNVGEVRVDRKIKSDSLLKDVGVRALRIRRNIH